jgi:hypothetical protein
MSDLESLRKKIAEEEARLARVEKERTEVLAKLQELKGRLAVEDSAPTLPKSVPSDEEPSRSEYLPQSRQPNSPASNRHRQPRSGATYPPEDSFPSGRLILSESIRTASEIPIEVDLTDDGAVPAYVRISEKVLHLRRSGMKYDGTCERLGINRRMAMSAVHWARPLVR